MRERQAPPRQVRYKRPVGDGIDSGSQAPRVDEEPAPGHGGVGYGGHDASPQPPPWRRKNAAPPQPSPQLGDAQQRRDEPAYPPHLLDQIYGAPYTPEYAGYLPPLGFRRMMPYPRGAYNQGGYIPESGRLKPEDLTIFKGKDVEFFLANCCSYAAMYSE